MVIFFLIFWETAILFSTAAAPFNITTSYTEGFWLLHIFADTIFFKIMGILMDVKKSLEFLS